MNWNETHRSAVACFERNRPRTADEPRILMTPQEIERLKARGLVGRRSWRQATRFAPIERSVPESERVDRAGKPITPETIANVGRLYAANVTRAEIRRRTNLSARVLNWIVLTRHFKRPAKTKEAA